MKICHFYQKFAKESSIISQKLNNPKIIAKVEKFCRIWSHWSKFFHFRFQFRRRHANSCSNGTRRTRSTWAPTWRCRSSRWGPSSPTTARRAPSSVSSTVSLLLRIFGLWPKPKDPRNYLSCSFCCCCL